MSRVHSRIARLRRVVSSLLLLAGLHGTPVAASDAPLAAAADFAQRRAQDGYALLLGPSTPPVPSVAVDADCAALYARRLALLRADLDYRPSFWRDPRHAGAVFIGTVWTPAFYYLPYRAVTAVTAETRDAQRAAELDALRAASAQARCFTR